MINNSWLASNHRRTRLLNITYTNSQSHLTFLSPSPNTTILIHSLRRHSGGCSPLTFLGRTLLFIVALVSSSVTVHASYRSPPPRFTDLLTSVHHLCSSVPRGSLSPLWILLLLRLLLFQCSSVRLVSSSSFCFYYWFFSGFSVCWFNRLLDLLPLGF
ncbi:uncharacterized protein LOC110278288 [Arachis duranensis]|uniref:Uncharacterized protein LOC110278288 n=1 Tax=Arachis duranensis TaxID=130453 RepID=A0A6P5N4G1_ARADU|nr:uncharacterized protein LOC110278288 [Arachis duranensis]